MSDILNFIGSLLSQIMNIDLPWYDLTFGQALLGPLFIGLLIGVFKVIFTSINHPGGEDIKND